MSLAQYTALSADTPVAVASNDTPAVSNNPRDTSNPTSLENEFITLMVAQIQNQDPLNPLDGTEYVGQLAQFSQVQSMENMSGLMQNSMVLLDNMQVLSTAGLVGQTVYVSSNEFELNEGVQSGRIELGHASNQVTLVVKDEYGQKTKVPLGAHAAGDVDFSIDPEKLGLKPGKYSVSVEVEEGQASPNV
ncbi:flagellar hook capping FlgD N-terminal domain-containing protein, partial [Vibrio rotiferianus]